MSKIKIGDVVRVRSFDDMLYMSSFYAGKNALWLVKERFTNNHGVEMYVLVSLIHNNSELWVDASYAANMIKVSPLSAHEASYKSLIENLIMKDEKEKKEKKEKEFLEELRNLLAKYEMSIYGGCSDFDSESPYVSFEGKGLETTFFLKEDGRGGDIPITADNIMDYNKE